MFMLMCCVHRHFCNVDANVLCSDIFVMFMLMSCVHRHFCNVHANVLCSQTFL